MADQHEKDRLWSAIRLERGALADDLADLDDEAWATPSLCAMWTVEDVVAHLIAGASVGRARWLGSILAARFDADLHNRRRLSEYRGRTAGETLQRFRAIVHSRTAPSGHTAAWLGEVIVHAEDVRRPLGIVHRPPVDAVTEVAHFYAKRDFTVSSSRAIRDLRLEAIDGPFATGEGALARGTTLALTMAMAGRGAYIDELTGPGASILGARHADDG
jgi:uncharacterized protein (TIGR03083 family)